MEAFKPQIDRDDRYAVVVPAGTFVVPIMSYGSLDELKQGYRQWRANAKQGKMTLPLPVEFISEPDSNRKRTCRILNDLIKQIEEESLSN